MCCVAAGTRYQDVLEVFKLLLLLLSRSHWAQICTSDSEYVCSRYISGGRDSLPRAFSLRCHKIVDKRLGQMPVTERGYYQSHSEIQTLDGASASIKRRIKTEALYIGACIFQCQ